MIAKKIVRDNFKNDYGEPFELTDGQADIFNLIYLRLYPRNEVICATQYGKKISDDTPVLTTKGWSTHGRLKVGDYVYSPSGFPVRVLNTLNNGKDVDLEVEFSNGEKIKCHRQHEWLLARRDWRATDKPYRIIETQKLDSRYRYAVPIIKPLVFSAKSLPVDPYFFGAWLGDGTTGEALITNHPKDNAIIENIKYNISSTSIHKKTGVNTVRFGGNDIRKYLQVKRIPDIYKFSSIEQRLQLLAGFIDTDGTVNKPVRENGWRNGRVYLINSNKGLIDDLEEIVNGLGIRTSITMVEPSMSSSGIKGRKRVYYLGFQPTIDIPTVLPRKKAMAMDKQKRYTVKNVKEIPPENGQCITVEGGVYLVGRKLVPTHNSDTVAMALIVRSIEFKEPWAIISGQKDKAQIIMSRVLQHIFDNERFYKQLELDANMPLDRLKRERSKDNIMFLGGGGIRTFTANTKNKQSTKEALTGFGSPNIVEDEASLVPDEVQAMILRMLGGHRDNFLLKIGNPFYRNHFMRTSQSDKYHNILIDHEQGLREGRYQPEFIEEMRQEAFFDILYACKFPESNTVTPDGYMRLFPEDLLEKCFIEEGDIEGEKKLGCDFAGGGNDRSAYVLKGENIMRLLETNQIKDTMQQVRKVEKLTKEYDIEHEDIGIDFGGLGQGIGDRLHEVEVYTNNVFFGSSAPENFKDRFLNMRSYMYYEFFKWLQNGGKIIKDDSWNELSLIYYKVDTQKKLQIQSKEEIKKLAKKMGVSISSPDVADAGALCFADNSEVVSDEDFDIL